MPDKSAGAVDSSLATSESILSLFDAALPQDDVERIVRFMSSRPSYVHSQRYVKTDDVLNLLGTSEGLRKEALKQFQAASFKDWGTLWDFTE